MPGSTLAVLGVAAVAFGLAVAAVVLVSSLRGLRAGVEQVHIIVNQQRTDAANYQRALVRALREAGVAVPADQSLPPEESPEEDPPVFSRPPAQT